MLPIRLELRYFLPATTEKIWPILADTERLNRQLGLPPTTPQALATDPTRVARVRARFFFLNVEWDEEPFEFVEGDYYWVRRRMLGGPLKEFNGGLSLHPGESGTEIHVN